MSTFSRIILPKTIQEPFKEHDKGLPRSRSDPTSSHIHGGYTSQVTGLKISAANILSGATGTVFYHGLLFAYLFSPRVLCHALSIYVTCFPFTLMLCPIYTSPSPFVSHCFVFLGCDFCVSRYPCSRYVFVTHALFVCIWVCRCPGLNPASGGISWPLHISVPDSTAHHQRSRGVHALRVPSFLVAEGIISR